MTERKLLHDQPDASSTSRIVIVEDDPSVARLVATVLQREGYSVEHASTITAARKLLDNTEWDLAILDRSLPDGDGMDLCRELKQNDAGIARYVLILTGEASQSAKVESFDGGADDYVTKPFQIPELLARIRAGLRIVELQKALVDANQRLQRLSVTDPLTSVKNRRFLEQELERTFAHARRYQRPLSAVMVDVDFFKRVNDTWGHQVGDDVLRAVGALLRKISRRVDTVARYGGEEFVILLPEIQLFDALSFAEKIRSSIASAEIHSEGRPLRVTVSVGVASFPQTPVRSADELIAAADRALYRAKQNGRNRVEVERRGEGRDSSSPSRSVARGA